MKSKILIVCALFFVAANTFAKSKFIDVPGKNEVTVVGRVHFSSDVDRNFLFETFGVDSDKRNYPDVYVLPFIPGKASGILLKRHKVDDLEDFDKQAWGVIVQYSLTKERTLLFDYMTLFIGGSYMIPVKLPLKFQVNVPKDEKFLYLGDFYFDAKGFSFDLSSSVKDEYEAAQLALNGVTKKEYKLARANLEQATDEEIKNIEFTYEVPITKFKKWYKMLKKRGLIEAK